MEQRQPHGVQPMPGPVTWNLTVLQGTDDQGGVTHPTIIVNLRLDTVTGSHHTFYRVEDFERFVTMAQAVLVQARSGIILPGNGQIHP